CQHFHIDPQATMAFGDGINDLEMLQAAGAGVAMGQGREEIKAIADYVTDSVDRDGIVTALQAFGQL
ncbi:MAG: HAD hydrolase family protein, partial [Holdemania filiformis]